MLRVNQVKVPVSHTEEQLKKKTAEMLRVIPADIRELKIIRQSIDARKKPDIFYSYSVDVSVRGEEKILRRFANKSSQVSRTEEEKYVFPKPGNRKREGAVVIAGMGSLRGFSVPIFWRCTGIARLCWSGADGWRKESRMWRNSGKPVF